MEELLEDFRDFIDETCRAEFLNWMEQRGHDLSYVEEKMDEPPKLY